MAKVKAKTTETKKSVSAFVKTVEDKQRQKDCFAIIEIMKKQSGFEPKMWGPAIIGFGTYHYKYESGHEGDAPLVGFSPRKSEFALYIANFIGKEELLKSFGKHKTAKSCVYIKKIEDIDVEIFKKMVTGSVKHMQAKYP
jgi:hypothetical protein